MDNISLAAANSIYTISNLILVIGAVFTVAGTVGAIWSGKVREHYADLRISTNETKTANAIADAARANERAAALDKEAAALKLELHQRTQPLVTRSLSVGQKQALKSVLGGHAFEIHLLWGGMDPEVIQYANELRSVLLDCGLLVPVTEANVLVVSGMHIAGPDTPEFRLLRDALKSADIAFETTDHPPFVNKDAIAIIVGLRPALQHDSG